MDVVALARAWYVTLLTALHAYSRRMHATVGRPPLEVEGSEVWTTVHDHAELVHVAPKLSHHDCRHLEADRRLARRVESVAEAIERR
jgi:hypothetical protein